METLSVNLSRGDVTVLLRAVEEAIAACACARGDDGQPCDRCADLRAVHGDLASVATRRPARRATLPVRWRDSAEPEWHTSLTGSRAGGALALRRPLDC